VDDVRRPLVLLILTISLGSGACSGADPAASPQPSTTTSAPTDADPADEQPFSVTVDGREFSGHCTGDAASGSPTVILESGLGGDQYALGLIEEQLAARTKVCAYDRAGIGGSDQPADTPRPVTDLVSDLHGVLTAAEIEPPYLLVGQSMGANIVFMYAQAYPDEVNGFVAMNPVPPYTDWIRRARAVYSSKAELRSNEISFYEGANDEEVSFQSTDGMLADPLPSSMPYTVMFAEDCGGDTEFCDRVLLPLSAATRTLAAVGEGGSFVWVKGAGHEIFVTDLDTVMEAIDGAWSSS
jgi:pimeloyl-ACP methyl ester carboxylesterase